MGIEDINQILKERVPHAFTYIPLRSFQGYAIAIDAACWLFANKSGALKDALQRTTDAVGGVDQGLIIAGLTDAVIRFLARLMASNITPIWILDGETRPEKKAAQERRTSAKGKIKDKIETEKIRLLSLHPLERVSADAEFRRLLLNNIFVTKEEIMTISSIVASMGVPVIVAPHDAEALGSVLALEKKVAAVWTTDTDVYLFGIPIAIKGFAGYVGGEQQVEVVLPSLAIQGLGMSMAEFVDLCIILQCDFNVRMKGNGKAFALKIIEEHRSIEAGMSAYPTKPWDDLCHVRCRQIFTPFPSSIPTTSLRLDKTRLEAFNAIRMDRDLAQAFHHLPDPQPSPW